MIKKGFTILLVLLTTIVLMGHAVIPHHHHQNNEICIVNPEKSSESENHNHGDCDGNEEHNKTGDDLYCILQKILIVRTDDNTEQESKFLKSFDHQSVDINSFILFNKHNSDSLLPEIFQKFENHQIVPLNSGFVSHLNGLRAPPIV